MKSNHKAAKAAINKAGVLETATSSTSVALVEAKSIQKENAVDIDKPLDAGEKKQLEQLETTIKKGFKTFYQVYEALFEIHDKGLYREYGTFEQYCDKKWGISRSQGHRCVAFVKCVTNLKSRQLATNEPLAIPANEAQGRRMAGLEPEQQIVVARKVALKTKTPKAKDFDHEAKKLTEDEPRVQSYDIRGEEEKRVKKSSKGLITLTEMHELIVQIYNDYSSSQDQKVGEGLRKLKVESKKLADREQQLNREEAV
jgi:hypothetical protein